MNAIQKKLLDMLSWFHDYCVNNDITYYCIGGTVLGAMRHGGFIPWDDDIDIGIPRCDYNKLINSFSNLGQYRVESTYSEDNKFLYTYAKIYDSNTTLIERSRIPCKRGVYIDVFPLDFVGNSIDEAVVNFRKFDKKKKMLMSRTCAVRKERKWYKNLSIIAFSVIPSFLINNKKLAISLDKLADSINSDCSESKYIANLSGTYRIKEITPRDFFGRPILCKFETISVFCPEKSDEYLTNIYGDWRQLPPEGKRKSLHDYIFIDLNSSYINN